MSWWIGKISFTIIIVINALVTPLLENLRKLFIVLYRGQIWPGLDTFARRCATVDQGELWASPSSYFIMIWYQSINGTAEGIKQWVCYDGKLKNFVCMPCGHDLLNKLSTMTPRTALMKYRATEIYNIEVDNLIQSGPLFTITAVLVLTLLGLYPPHGLRSPCGQGSW